MGQIGAGNSGAGYPSSLDTLLYNVAGVSAYVNAVTNIPDSNRRCDAEGINDIIDCLIAIETELGTDPSGGYATVKARLDALTPYTDENAQDTIGSILVDTATIDFTYNDGTPSITASVINDSITYAKIQNVTATNRLLARYTASAGDVEEASLATGIRFNAGALDYDINNLTADGTPDMATDYVVTWDSSASAHKKVLLTLIATGGGSYTDENAQDTIGSILVDTSTIDLTYNDGTPSITADVINDSITYAKIQNVTATNRLLARYTASAGDVEEASLATGIRFNAGALDYDINNLTADGTPDTAADYVVTWDNSASTHKKVLLSNLSSGTITGSGAANKVALWSSSSALTSDTALHYDSTGNDLLIGSTTFGTGLKNGLVLFNDSTTTPSTDVTDSVQLYAADQTAGATSLYIRSEDSVFTSIGSRLLLNGTTRLANGVAAGGIQLDCAGPAIQMSYAANIDHGMTSIVATSVYFDMRQISSEGGIQLRAFSEGTLATILSTIGTTDPVSTKTNSSTAALRFEFGKKSSTTIGGMGTGVNLAIFYDGFVANGTRWILDNDGDTWQSGSATLGTSLLTNNSTLLTNGVASGGVQLESAGPTLQMSNAGFVAHGMTSIVATSVYLDMRPVVAGEGGIQVRGFTETSLATILSSIVTTDPSTTKSNSADGALRFEYGKKSGTTIAGMGTGVNLAVFSDTFVANGTRWIIDNDGDTWQSGSLTFDGSMTTGGNTARSLTVNRHTTGNTAGNNFTIETGGATSGATDKIGGNFLLKTGIGTGNAVPSTLQIQAPYFSGAAGTSSQTLVNRWLLNGTANLTSGAATTLITIPLATLQQAGGAITYSIDVSDGTDMLNLAGNVTYSAVNKGGTYTTSSSVLGTESLAKSDITDTLVTSFTFNNGSNQTQLQITVTATGITPTTFKITYEVSTGAQQNVTLG
jgi:hypothetical protein